MSVRVAAKALSDAGVEFLGCEIPKVCVVYSSEWPC